VQNGAAVLDFGPPHLPHHPHPTANAATFPARGKAGARRFYPSGFSIVIQ
jgi:hypothetical protein